MATYTTCPSCGTQYPIGNQHDCPTHIRPSVLIGIVAVLLFIGLLGGSSCNFHLEIKQKPAKVETKE